MRIWSIHPELLDPKGLTALWREALLAKHVLAGKTKGYTNHPQLARFKTSPAPLDCISYYLSCVYEEATKRGYHFNRDKVDWDFHPVRIPVTTGQLLYEKNHLLDKLFIRNPSKYYEVKKTDPVKAHPLFHIIKGGVENWEKVIQK